MAVNWVENLTKRFNEVKTAHMEPPLLSSRVCGDKPYVFAYLIYNLYNFNINLFLKVTLKLHFFINNMVITHYSQLSVLKTKRRGNTPQRGTPLPRISVVHFNPSVRSSGGNPMDSHQEVSTSWDTRV